MTTLLTSPSFKCGNRSIAMTVKGFASRELTCINQLVEIEDLSIRNNAFLHSVTNIVYSEAGCTSESILRFDPSRQSFYVFSSSMLTALNFVSYLEALTDLQLILE